VRGHIAQQRAGFEEIEKPRGLHARGRTGKKKKGKVRRAERFATASSPIAETQRAGREESIRWSPPASWRWLAVLREWVADTAEAEGRPAGAPLGTGREGFGSDSPAAIAPVGGWLRRRWAGRKPGAVGRRRCHSPAAPWPSATAQHCRAGKAPRRPEDRHVLGLILRVCRAAGRSRGVPCVMRSGLCRRSSAMGGPCAWGRYCTASHWSIRTAGRLDEAEAALRRAHRPSANRALATRTPRTPPPGAPYARPRVWHVRGQLDEGPSALYRRNVRGSAEQRWGAETPGPSSCPLEQPSPSFSTTRSALPRGPAHRAAGGPVENRHAPTLGPARPARHHICGANPCASHHRYPDPADPAGPAR